MNSTSAEDAEVAGVAVRACEFEQCTHGVTERVRRCKYIGTRGRQRLRRVKVLLHDDLRCMMEGAGA